MTSRDIEGLFPHLESEDAFERLDAEQRLRDLTQRDFGFRWDAGADERASALSRVRAWLLARKKSRERAAAVLPAGFSAVDLQKLKGLPQEEVEKHLQALLAKAQLAGVLGLGRPRCEACRRRSATVEVVDLPGGGSPPVVTSLCDPCAVKRGDVRGR